MIKFIKKYWDIISGIVSAIGLTIISEFELEALQLYYSIAILILVSIGAFRIIKQTIADKQQKKKEREQNLIDIVVDSQKPMKAISLAQSPIKEGEKLGKLLIKLWEVVKKAMGKIKLFFEKFKGIITTIALGVLTAVEMCGGFINELCGGVLVIEGVEILPLVTLGAAVVVGILSNGYSNEDNAKIKALFSKSTKNELVKEEIKKALKEKSAQKTQLDKILANQQHELANLNSERERISNTFEAKIEMNNMIPQLASVEDVQIAQNAVLECDAKIKSQTDEINETTAMIEKLTTTINALKSQL